MADIKKSVQLNSYGQGINDRKVIEVKVNSMQLGEG